MLGNPIDLKSAATVEAPLRASSAGDAFVSHFVRWLYELGSRFAAVVLYQRPLLY